MINTMQVGYKIIAGMDVLKDKFETRTKLNKRRDLTEGVKVGSIKLLSNSPTTQIEINLTLC